MTWRIIGSIAFLAALLAGPMPVDIGAAEDKKKAAAAASAPVWPLPPDPPRIRFVTAYHGLDDFKKKKSRWKSMLLGPDEQMQIDQLMKPYGVAAANDAACSSSIQRRRQWDSSATKGRERSRSR